MSKQKVIELFPNVKSVPDEPKKKDKPKGQRKDGLVQVTKSFGRLPDGRRDVKVFYGKTMKEAREKRDAYVKEREGGMSLADKDLTVGEWIDRWKELYKSNLSYTNERQYKSHIKRIKNTQIGKITLSQMRMRDVRDAHLQKVLNTAVGMSKSTIHKLDIILKQIFSKARKNKIIWDDPSEDLEPPVGTVGSHRALERWEIDCILENYHEHRAGIWVMIMMLVGLRPGELAALQWHHVNLKKRSITVHQSAERKGNRMEDKDKTKSAAGMRVLPICDPLLTALLRVPDDERVGYVALSAKGKQLTESAIDRGWDGFELAMTRILRSEPIKQMGKRPKDRTPEEQAAIDALPKLDCRPHDMRHTFATALYDAGVDVKSAQYYLGHSDIRVTMELYTHLSEEKEKKSRAALIGFLDGWLIKKPEEEE